MEKRQSRWTWMTAVCAAWIVAAPMLQAFRGVDLTDTGFLLSNQYWFFQDPAGTAYWFHLWLTNLIGGAVVWLTGPVGLFASKIAAALVFWGLVWAVFHLYGKDVPSQWIWLGVAVTLSFDFAWRINIIHYNNLSVLFFAWGIVLLVEGAVHGRPSLFALAGAVLAANGLVRLPNILGMALVLVPFILNWFSRKAWRKWDLGWRHFFAFCGGGLATVLVALAAMAALGHLHLYWDSLMALEANTGDSDTRYGRFVVIRRVVKAVVLSMIGGVALGGGLALLGFLASRIRRVWLQFSIILVVGLVIGLVAGITIVQTKKVASPVIGIVYLVALAHLFWRPDPAKPRLSLAVTLASLVVFLLSWGSDTGVDVATFALPLAIPGVILSARLISWRWVKPACAILVVALAVFGCWKVGTQVYRDKPWVTTIANVPGIGPVLTAPDRARSLEAFTAKLGQYAQAGDEVLIVNSVPLMHYLTHTKPYLGNPWPDLFTRHELETAFATHEKTSLPVVVVVAAATGRSVYWPESFLPRPNRAVLDAFLDRHGFVLAEKTYEGEFYTRSKDAK